MLIKRIVLSKLKIGISYSLLVSQIHCIFFSLWNAKGKNFFSSTKFKIHKLFMLYWLIHATSLLQKNGCVNFSLFFTYTHTLQWKLKKKCHFWKCHYVKHYKCISVKTILSVTTSSHNFKIQIHSQQWMLLIFLYNFVTLHRSSWVGCPARPASKRLSFQNEAHQRREDAAHAADVVGRVAPELLLYAAGDRVCGEFDWQTWGRNQNYHALWPVTGE